LAAKIKKGTQTNFPHYASGRSSSHKGKYTQCSAHSLLKSMKHGLKFKTCTIQCTL